MFDLELSQASLELRNLGTKHLGTTDLLLVMIRAFVVSACLHALGADRPLTVAFLK